ncbi:MAG: class I SAM-dependent methyltransferase [Bacteroidetes bacterium]|nr:class I SAM-dependent methyltransferase [Bacteroidota bacterium]
MKGLYHLVDYMGYLFTASTRHGVHSPFVYRFTDEILYGRERHPAFDLIENIRRKMIKSTARIQFEDHGGGKNSGTRSVSSIASRTARQAKYGRLLYRILRAFQPQYCLELGTGTGITALYQACALGPFTPLHSIEGSPKLAEIARYNAEQAGLTESLMIHSGTFETVLPELLSHWPQVDYAYIDGNHRMEPTLSYFDTLLPKCHAGTILIFDDINWSEEMKMAWATIKNHPRVTVTLDIFAFGIVFFHQGQEKEHFTLRY